MVPLFLQRALPTANEVWQPLVMLQQTGLSLCMRIAAALIILFVGQRLARWIGRIARKVLLRGKIDVAAASFIADSVYVLLLIFAIVPALGSLGLETTSFAAIIAAGGVAIGLALQGSLSNVASGLLLIIFKPFKVGDSIEMSTTSGTVEEIHILNTLLRAADNVQIIIPNSQVTQAIVKNYSAKETRRLELIVGCAYDENVMGVKLLLEELLRGDDHILTDPAPTVAVTEFSEKGPLFAVRGWVKTGEYAGVKENLAERVKLAFDERKFKLVGSKS